MDFFFLLPELYILYTVLHCLLTISKFDWQQSRSAFVISKHEITSIILTRTLENLHICLVLVASLFLYNAVDTVLYIEFNEDATLFSNNHHFISDGYTLLFKFMLIFSTRLLLQASIDYLLQHPRSIMEFAILTQLFIFFLSILISANDLVLSFIAVVGFSLSTYVLILTDSSQHNTREAAIKYYYLSALSSGMLAFGIWLCYLLFNSTNFVEIEWILQLWKITDHFTKINHLGLLSACIYFILFGFLFKLAAFPCHLWAADVYEGSPQTILAFFVIPIKISVLGFIFRIFIFTFKDLIFLWHPIFMLSAITSMVGGAFYALVEKRIRKFLAYSSISQMGFLLSGITYGTIQCLTAAIIFLIIYIIMNLGLFIILLNTTNKKDNRPLLYITDLQFFTENNALYSILLTVILFSMAGIPPLAGFFGKYFLFLTIFQAKGYLLVICGLFSSVISAYYYLRIIKWLWFEQKNEKEENLQFIVEMSQGLQDILIIIAVLLVFYISLLNNWLYTMIDSLLWIN